MLKNQDDTTPNAEPVNEAANAAIQRDGTGCQAWLSVGTLNHLATILRSVGHDPSAAAAGWRSEDPLVVALLLAAHGYPVFPCSKFKHPLISNGVNGATTDLRTILYWARDKAAAGWCVKTGRYDDPSGPPGLWIQDIDDASGYARLAELEAELEPLAKTWTCMSARQGGGEHRLSAPCSSGPDMKTVGKALINGARGGIDQRGRGGYAVIAGSLHKSGGRYRWAGGCAPDETPLATHSQKWAEAMDKADVIPALPLGLRIPKPRKRIAPKTGGGGNATLGDDPGGGGFHGPINVLAIRYFEAAGPDASAETAIAILRRLIEAAPKAADRDISRYLSAEYLMDAVESARTYVRTKRNVE